VLAVGGHTRNIGKTALVVDLIRAFPEAAWTAIKITQYGHGVCSIHGEECGCAPDEHLYALDEEADRNNRTDTSRFLVAGAARAFWLRSKQGRLAEAMPLVRDAMANAPAAAPGRPPRIIIESNTLLQFLRPALYLVVLDPSREDFKESAQRFLDRADAFVLRAPFPANWSGVPARLIEQKPRFAQPLGAPLPEELRRFVCERYFA
jgi:hypothetical protein